MSDKYKRERLIISSEKINRSFYKNGIKGEDYYSFGKIIRSFCVCMI